MAEEVIFNGVVTASGATPAFAADSFSTVSADIAITAIGGTTPSYTFQLQSSPDGVSGWFNVGAASSAQTANGNVAISSGAGAFDGAYARVAYTVSGTTPTANLQIWMDGK
jgi:hypothetical protein